MCGGEWHLEVEEQAVVLGLFSNNHAESYGQHDQLGGRAANRRAGIRRSVERGAMRLLPQASLRLVGRCRTLQQDVFESGQTRACVQLCGRVPKRASVPRSGVQPHEDLR